MLRKIENEDHIERECFDVRFGVSSTYSRSGLGVTVRKYNGRQYQHTTSFETFRQLSCVLCRSGNFGSSSQWCPTLNSVLRALLLDCHCSFSLFRWPFLPPNKQSQTWPYIVSHLLLSLAVYTTGPLSLFDYQYHSYFFILFSLRRPSCTTVIVKDWKRREIFFFCSALPTRFCFVVFLFQVFCSNDRSASPPTVYGPLGKYWKE